MKTTRAILTAAVSAGLCGFAAPEAAATTINWNNNYRTGSGGEFTLVDTGLDLSAYATTTTGVIGADSFQTFCVEINEHISKGQTVTYNLNDGAVNGGVGGGNPDFLSQGTAFLYSQFAAGTLVGYDYTPGSGRQAAAGELQNAIWFLEDELTMGSPLTNPFLSAASTLFGDLATAKLNQTGSTDLGVKVVNLYSNNGNTWRQDQLYFSPGDTPTPPFNVPDGGTSVLLLGVALTGLGAARRAITSRAPAATSRS